MPSQVTKRFNLCFQELIKSKSIRSARQFAEEVSCYPQALNEILKERREVNHDILEQAIAKYNINAQFLFTGNGPMFLSELKTNDLTVLTIVTDHHRKEQIIHVPIEAHAGYSLQQNNPNYIGELQSYNLPNFKFVSECTMRSFEVKGESMNPVFLNGDYVICAYIHSCMWDKSIYENKYYVIVTKDGIVLKKITDRLKQESILILHSENDEFSSYSVAAKDIIEIWEVKAKITSQFKKVNTENHSFIQLEKRFDKYESMLQSLTQKVLTN